MPQEGARLEGQGEILPPSEVLNLPILTGLVYFACIALADGAPPFKPVSTHLMNLFTSPARLSQSRVRSRSRAAWRTRASASCSCCCERATTGVSWKRSTNAAAGRTGWDRERCTGWITDAPLCEWKGVTEDAGGNVTALELYGIKVTHLGVAALAEALPGLQCRI